MLKSINSVDLADWHDSASDAVQILGAIELAMETAHGESGLTLATLATYTYLTRLLDDLEALYTA